MLYRLKPIVLVLLILILASLACMSSSADKLSDAANQSTQASESRPTNQPLETEPVQPTEAPEPSATPAPKTEPLKLLDNQGYVQDGITVASVFLVENPNLTAAIESSEYQVIVYDDADAVLATDSGNINLVLPEDTQAVVSEVYLEEGQKAAKVEIQMHSGTASPTDLEEIPFTFEKIEYIPDEYSPTATGILKNGLSQTVRDLMIAATALDAEGNFIGGGYTYLDFLPAAGQSPVEVSMTVAEQPDQVVFYAALTSMSGFEESGDGQAVQLLSYGYGLDDYQVAVAFLVQNTDPVSPVDGTQYQVAAYDADGNVLDTDSGYVNLLFPGEITAVASDLYLPEGKALERVEVQINPGSTTSHVLTTSPFTTEQVKFMPGSYASDVTGLILNASDKNITDLEVVAVAYDDQDQIVGGGYTYLDFIPPNGKTAAEVSVVVTGTPARVELFVSLTSMSSLE